MTDICVFCKTNASTNNVPIRSYDASAVSCPICGDYDIDNLWITMYATKEVTDSIKISAFLRQSYIEKRKISIHIDPNNKDNINSLDEIIINFPKSIDEKLNRTLLNLSKLSESPGEYITIAFSTDYPIFYPTKKTEDSVRFIMLQLIEDKYIEFHHDYNYPHIYESNFKTKIKLTPKGWNKVAELESTNKDSKKVFVAMWFSDNMLQVFDDHIKPALDSIGYNANHVGITQHNDDINDKIIAEIKTSKFIIADLTGDRGGVYFEAGFAKGLGLPVIFTCREDWFRKELTISINDTNMNSRSVHFDIEHKNIIVWKQDCSDLKEKLIDRIRATID